MMRSKLSSNRQNLDVQWLALGVLQAFGRLRPAGLCEERRGLAQLRSVVAGAVGLRRLVGRPEYLGRKLVAIGLEQGQLLGRRRPRRLHVGILEEACRALVETEEQVAVAPLEIEGEIEGAAHADILELLAAHVDEEALGARRALVGNREAEDAAILDGRLLVARRPILGGELLAKVEVTGEQVLELEAAITVIVVANLVEVIEAAADRQVLGPVVVAAQIGDVSAGLEVADLIRA